MLSKSPGKGRSGSSYAGSSRQTFVLGLVTGSVMVTLFFTTYSILSREGSGVAAKLGSPASRQSSKSATCTDTCFKAKDGVCDEGRWPTGSKSELEQLALLETLVHCDYGTDCFDCGTFYGTPSTASWEGGAGPVSFNTESGVQIFAATMKTSPPFIFHYTNWSHDDDVSLYVHLFQQLEGGITMIFRDVLRNHCVRPDGTRSLVVDVGANFGYFAVYAAMMGCRVVAWEPVPRFRAFFERSVAANNVSHLIDIRTTAISSGEKGQVVSMKVPIVGNWGTASIGGLNTGSSDHEWVNTTCESVDGVVSEHVLLMKVDVEGHEAPAMSSAFRLLSEHGVDNIILEYNPHVLELAKDLPKIQQNVGMLIDLAKNYKIVHLPDPFAKGLLIPDAVPALPEVSMANLKYDLEDMRRGCRVTDTEVTRNLASRFEAWRYWLSRPCLGRFPAFAHPKSFRSSFYGNTNLWFQLESFVTEGPGKMKLNGSCSAFNMNTDSRKVWRADNIPGLGLARLDCVKVVEPGNQVIWRCPCSKPEKCGEEERAVMELFQQGKFEHVYEL